MDFSWSEQQQTLYTSIFELSQELNSASAQSVKERWSLCAELGVLGLSAPIEYGGRGLGALSTAHALEAFGRGCQDMGLVFSVAAHLLACVMPIAEYGSDAIKKELLPGLCDGRLIAANAITEQDAGSDVLALKTRGVRTPEGYIVNGHKSYVTNGPIADVFVTYAVTNPAYGYLGISAFVILNKTSGISVGPSFNKMGLDSTPASIMTMTDCPVPETYRIGKEGQGALIFKRSMQWERACLFAAYVGMMDRQLEQTIQYSKDRVQFGKPIGKNQAVSHRIADMKLRLESARLLLYKSCWLLDQSSDAPLDIALSKLAVSEAAIQSSIDAIQIHGSIGFLSGHGIESMLRDSIPSTLFSGTSELQREFIVRELGL